MTDIKPKRRSLSRVKAPPHPLIARLRDDFDHERLTVPTPKRSQYLNEADVSCMTPKERNELLNSFYKPYVANWTARRPKALGWHCAGLDLVELLSDEERAALQYITTRIRGAQRHAVALAILLSRESLKGKQAGKCRQHRLALARAVGRRVFKVMPRHFLRQILNDADATNAAERVASRFAEWSNQQCEATMRVRNVDGRLVYVSEDGTEVPFEPKQPVDATFSSVEASEDESYSQRKRQREPDSDKESDAKRHRPAPAPESNLHEFREQKRALTKAQAWASLAEHASELVDYLEEVFHQYAGDLQPYCVRQNTDANPIPAEGTLRRFKMPTRSRRGRLSARMVFMTVCLVLPDVIKFYIETDAFELGDKPFNKGALRDAGLLSLELVLGLHGVQMPLRVGKDLRYVRRRRPASTFWGAHSHLYRQAKSTDWEMVGPDHQLLHELSGCEEAQAEGLLCVCLAGHRLLLEAVPDPTVAKREGALLSCLTAAVGYATDAVVDSV